MGRKKRRIEEQDEGGGGGEARSTPNPNKKHMSAKKLTHAPWWNWKMQEISQNHLHVPNESHVRHKTNISWIQADTLFNRNPYEPLSVGESYEPFIKPLQQQDDETQEKYVNHVAKRSEQECPPTHVVRCFKIKLKPDQGFKNRAQQWIRTCRLWRKLALTYLFKQHPKGFQKAPNWKNLRQEIMDRKNGPFANHRYRDYLFNKWEMVHGEEKETKVYCTKDMKVEAIHTLCSSIGSTIESLKEKKRKEQGKLERTDILHAGKFDMKHQTQQNRCQSVDIVANGGKPSITWSEKGGFVFNKQTNPYPVFAKNKRDYATLYKLFQQHNIDFPLTKQQKVGVVGCQRTVTLKYDRNHGYFLCIPYFKKKQEFRNRRKAVASDPGVRAPQTTYDSAGDSTKYGYRQVGRLMCLAKKMDRIQSKLDTPSEDRHNKKKRRLKRKFRLLSAKIEHLKTDFHWQLASHLCKNYEHVMIPKFAVSQMVNRFKRKIRSTTVREMLHWSHFAFRQRLICKGEELSTQVHVVGEQYTSIACGGCGLLNRSLGGSEHFTCSNCSYSCDRDRGGSRSIYLKNVDACVGHYELQEDSDEPLIDVMARS